MNPIFKDKVTLTRPLNETEQCPSCGCYTYVEYNGHFAGIACCGREFLVGYDGKKIDISEDKK